MIHRIHHLLSVFLIWLMAALPLLSALPVQQSHASLRYSNTQGITFATIGEGDITVRDYTDFDLSALNRDVNNVQRVTSEEYFELDIPGINLARLSDDIRDATRTLRAATATVPEEVREQGAQAVDLFRDAIVRGLSPEKVRAFVASPSFARQVRVRNNIADLKKQYGSVAAIPASEFRQAIGESRIFDQDSKTFQRIARLKELVPDYVGSTFDGFDEPSFLEKLAEKIKERSISEKDAREALHLLAEGIRDLGNLEIGQQQADGTALLLSEYLGASAALYDASRDALLVELIVLVETNDDGSNEATLRSQAQAKVAEWNSGVADIAQDIGTFFDGLIDSAGFDQQVTDDLKTIAGTTILAGSAVIGRRGGGSNGTVHIDEGKFDFLFGRVTSGTHNTARSQQIETELARVGVHDTSTGRKIITDHLDDVVKDTANITDKFTKTINGQVLNFEIRQSLFSGPGGFLQFNSTFIVNADGTRSLSTIIPKGGN